MSKTELLAKLQKEGQESAHLDDIVHEAASHIASSVNNGGLDSQIDFLLDVCGWTEDVLLGQLGL